MRQHNPSLRRDILILAMVIAAVLAVVSFEMHRHNKQREVPKVYEIPKVYVEAEGPHEICPIEDLVKIEREPRPLKIPCVTVENQND